MCDSIPNLYHQQSDRLDEGEQVRYKRKSRERKNGAVKILYNELR